MSASILFFSTVGYVAGEVQRQPEQEIEARFDDGEPEERTPLLRR